MTAWTPWPSVASALRQLGITSRYKWVRLGGRRRRLLAYAMPEQLEDVLPSEPVTNVVPLAERKAS